MVDPDPDPDPDAGSDAQAFSITPVPYGLHRTEAAWVFEYAQAGQVEVFLVVTEAPARGGPGLPRYRARLPSSFKAAAGSGQTPPWRALAATRMAAHLRHLQAWPPEALDLDDLDTYDGERPARIFW